MLVLAVERGQSGQDERKAELHRDAIAFCSACHILRMFG